MKIGLMFANGASASEPERATELAVQAESLGFESLWAVQHIVVPSRYTSRYPYSDKGTIPGGSDVAIPDPLIWLSYVAAKTRSIKLATGVLVLPQQHPLVVAKQVATLDRLSEGRMIVGLGAGWLEEEFRAVGQDFATRGRRLEEGIEVLRAAWASEPAAFHGETLDFDAVVVEPKPAQSRVPIYLGGHTQTAARRAARLADGFFPLAVRGAELRSLAGVLRGEAARAGRHVEITAEAPRDLSEARTVLDLGVDRVIAYTPARDGELRPALARIKDRVDSLLDEAGFMAQESVN
jgi:probable F420-dependent oxidoreductase